MNAVDRPPRGTHRALKPMAGRARLPLEPDAPNRLYRRRGIPHVMCGSGAVTAHRDRTQATIEGFGQSEADLANAVQLDAAGVAIYLLPVLIQGEAHRIHRTLLLPHRGRSRHRQRIAPRNLLTPLLTLSMKRPVTFTTGAHARPHRSAGSLLPVIRFAGQEVSPKAMPLSVSRIGSGRCAAIPFGDHVVGTWSLRAI